MKRLSKEFVLLSLVTATMILASAWSPVNRGLWLATMAPVLLVFVTLLTTASRFPLTALAYRTLFLGAIVVVAGAYYTFPLVPAGAWVQEHFHLARNHYDRLGHVMLGVAAAACAREVLLRSALLPPGRWLAPIAVCVAVVAGVACEQVEWLATASAETKADSLFLSPADRWDTNWDMLSNSIGAMLGAFALAPVHDAELSRAADWGGWPAARGNFPLMSTRRQASQAADAERMSA